MTNPETGAAGNRVQNLVVAGFSALCFSIFGFLWVNSGGTVPLQDRGYEVEVTVPRVGNVVYFSDVMMAGVKVGKVRDVTEEGDRARILMELDEDVAPLHEGATVQIGAKSLIEESFVEITDGDGAEIADGSALPEGSGRGPVQLDDVLATLDEPTRESLGVLVRAAGASTRDTEDEIAAAVSGLGEMGRSGEDVLDALADQSEDLSSLSEGAARVLTALSTRRAAIGDLVRNADLVSEAMAGESDELREVVRALPPLLVGARAASDDMQGFARALAPVAEDLAVAAPALDAALVELPGTARDLRGLLPALDGVVDDSPATLRALPGFGADVEQLLPTASTVMRDLNPMLAYLEPYGQELGNFFSNFAQTLALGDENGRIFRVMAAFNERSFFGNPFSTGIGPLDRDNPLPGAGTLDDPLQPYSGPYPRVERDPAPQ